MHEYWQYKSKKKPQATELAPYVNERCSSDDEFVQAPHGATIR
jgi:hypothetical protein